MPTFQKFLFKQGTEEWHEWRRQGIGASDAPIIMDVSPYSRPLRLYEEKLGLKEMRPIPVEVKERAEKFEAAARAWFEIMNDKDCPPMCIQMTEYPFIKASLDGFNEKENFILEIKYVGARAIEEPIPIHHMWQLQHQMMVSGASDVTYIRTTDGNRFKAEAILRDEKMIAELLEAEIKFQKMVEEKNAPQNIRRKNKTRSGKSDPGGSDRGEHQADSGSPSEDEGEPA